MLIEKILGHKEKIIGEKVYLRRFRLTDISQNYLRWLNDEDVNRFSQRRGIKTSLSAATRFIELHQTSGNSCVFVIEKRDTLEHVGNLMLSEYDDCHGLVEVANLIGNVDQWGQGLAVDATKAVLADLFIHHKLRKAMIGNISQNRAASFMARQLGFSLEGTLRKQVFLNDLGECDMYRFGIHREEFLSRWSSYIQNILGVVIK